MDELMREAQIILNGGLRADERLVEWRAFRTPRPPSRTLVVAVVADRLGYYAVKLLTAAGGGYGGVRHTDLAIVRQSAEQQIDDRSGLRELIVGWQTAGEVQ